MIFLCGSVIPSLLRAELPSVKVSFVEGTAAIQGPGDENWKPIEDTGVEIPPSSEVFVEKTSYLEFSVDNRDQLKINERTALSVGGNDQDTMELDLKLGGIKLEHKSDEGGTRPYKIRTPTSTIGIRGTEFDVFHEKPNESEVSVDEGLVNVTAGDESTLVRRDEHLTSRYDRDARTYRVTVEDGIPKRNKLVWSHWTQRRSVSKLQRKVQRLRARLEVLQRKLGAPGVPERTRKIIRREKKRIDDLLSLRHTELTEEQKKLAEISSSYFDYRKQLYQKHGKYAESQLQQFLGEDYNPQPTEQNESEGGGDAGSSRNKDDTDNSSDENSPYRGDYESKDAPDF